MMRGYGLPPGTGYELYTWCERERRHLANEAGRAFRQIADSLRSGGLSPEQTRRVTSLEFARSLERRLRSFAESLGRSELLEKVVANAMPLTDITQASGEMASREAFDVTYRHLQGRRSGLSINNFNDALNVSFAVRVFHSAAPHGSRKYIPTLISNTQALLRQDVRREWIGLESHQLPAGGPPRLVDNTLFLVVSAGLLRSVDDRHRLVVDRATILARETAILRDHYQRLLRSCQLLLRDGRPEDALSFPDLPSHEWELLQYRRSAFHQRWDFIVFPSVRLAEFDRIKYLNLYLSSRVRRLRKAVEDGSADTLAKAGRYLSATQPEYDLWGPIVELTRPAKAETIETASDRFSYSLCSDPSSLIASLTYPGPASPISPKRLQRRHTLRIAVFPRNVRSGPLFVAESQRKAQKTVRYLGIVWVHAGDAATVWRMSKALLCEVTRHARPEPCTFSIYSSSTKYIGEVNLDQQEGDHVIWDYVEEADRDNIDFLQVSSVGMTVYADLEPLETAEMQMGVLFPEKSLSAELIVSVARYMGRTHMLRLVDGSLHAGIIRAFRMLGARAGRNGGGS